MLAVDRIVVLDILYGVRLSVAADGWHLQVTGPSAVVPAIVPMIKHYRAELLAQLQVVAANAAPPSPTPQAQQRIE